MDMLCVANTLVEFLRNELFCSIGNSAAHGAGMAMSAAPSLASVQGTGGPKGLAGGMAHVGRTTANLGKAALQNLGGPMSGRSAFSARSANEGRSNLRSRMADSMTAKKVELTKPSAPASGDSSKDGDVTSGGAAAAPKATDTAVGTGRAGSIDSMDSRTGGTPGNETGPDRVKLDEFRDALRHFGNRIKAHNAGV